jgi:integrase
LALTQEDEKSRLYPTQSYPSYKAGDDDDPMDNFVYALKSEETRKQWPRRLKAFFDFLEIQNANTIKEQARYFFKVARQNSLQAQSSIIKFIIFQRERVQKGIISEATVPNYYKAIKLFCKMNDINLNWNKISCGLPKSRQAANDRAPTIAEIQKLVEYPDRRIKPIILTMASSGIRIGAWDYLRWKHVIPVNDEISKEILAARLIVYSGDREEYYTFITPEAYSALKDWMDFRALYGERISAESWLMRDIWKTTNTNFGAKRSLASVPKKLKHSGIKRLIEQALWEQGLRQPLKEGNKRHEWKAAHGFRKFYKSRTEQVMKPINVEITMGHDIGVSASYYKPTEKEVLDDYLKAVSLLTINDGDRLTLQKQVKELEENSKTTEYVIKGKLHEKDEEVKRLSEQYSSMESQMRALISTLGDMDEISRNKIARKMIESGIYTKETKTEDS